MEGERTGAPATSALRRYHEATKHSRASIARGAGGLDWPNKPRPFKIFTTLERIPPPDDIARLCRLSNGVLRGRRGPSGERYGFRAAACTGALYHVELYLATAERADLPAGLYHYGAHDHRLRQLRKGDVRGALLRSAGGFTAIAAAPLVIVLTSTFWRNAWKYRERAYRHTFWDSGAVIANVLALAADAGQPASVVMGFVDSDLDHIVGVDGQREATLAIVAIGSGAAAPGASPRLDDLVLQTERLSTREVRYQAIEAAHRASSLRSPEAVTAWRRRADATSASPPARLAGPSIESVIRDRRSTRAFSGESIFREDLERILQAVLAPIPGDAFGTDLVERFLIVNAVGGIGAGAYGPELTPIRTGDLRDAAAALALGQDLGATAAVDLYFLADLDAVQERFGERGYRVAQLAGGIAGGRVELAATALGLGATGLTFFDDEVTGFFEPAAEGRQVMYLAAVGRA
ncbi:MAG: SagB/ThcOx family dehydrogenase [Elusimicrobia bacterium]|nr:SagB/ThcOx family dehydrogenase [Elusimicrobiota bacterium]